MVLVEPLLVVEEVVAESAVVVVDTVVVAVAAAAAAVVVVVPSVSSSFEIVVVFPVGTAAGLYVAVAVAFSCSTSNAVTKSEYLHGTKQGK